MNKFVLVGIVLLALVGSVFAAYGNLGYSGWNQYYYTSNYRPTVYYPSPNAGYVGYANVYSYPAYNNYYSYNYSYPYTYYYPAVSTYVPTYNPYIYSSYGYAYPSRTLSIYSSGSSWGVSYNSIGCSYYGYC